MGTDDFNTVCGVMVWNRDKIEKLRNWFTSAEQNWLSASALQKHISCVCVCVCVVVQDFGFQHLG